MNALQRYEREELTLETLARRTGLHPAVLEQWVVFGLIQPSERRGKDMEFDPSAIPRVRSIRRLRGSLGVNLAGVGVILDLLDRLDALRRENEWLRRKL
jgi:DNA-binding transcriptional MerR regulator